MSRESEDCCQQNDELVDIPDECCAVLSNN